jgi:hypothetical protein
VKGANQAYPARIRGSVDLGLLGHLIELGTRKFLIGIVLGGVKLEHNFASFVDTALHEEIARGFWSDPTDYDH